MATSAARIRYFKSLELPTLIDGVSATNSNRKQNKILNALALMRQLRCAPLVSSWLSTQHKLGGLPGKDNSDVWTNDG